MELQRVLRNKVTIAIRDHRRYWRARGIDKLGMRKPELKGDLMVGAESDDDDRSIYKVVVNHEDQYSIWPVHRENPPGWTDAGFQGIKKECLGHIKEVWTDMRPLSLRRKLDNY